MRKYLNYFNAVLLIFLTSSAVVYAQTVKTTETLGGSDSMEYVELIKNLGIPGGFSVGLLVIIWRISNSVGTWLRPLLEKAVTEHFATMVELRTSYKSLSETVTVLVGSTKQDHEITHQCILAGTDVIKSAVRDHPTGPQILEKVDQIREIIKEKNY
jgi:hypothetical protein